MNRGIQTNRSEVEFSAAQQRAS